MKIGIITYDFAPPIGGLGIHVQRLLRALHTASPIDEMIVCSPSPHAPFPVTALARSRWNKKGGCPFFSLTLLWSLPSFIQHHGLDLLHMQSGSGGVFLLRKPGIPVLVTAHHTYIDEVHLVFKNPMRKILKWIMSRFEKRTYHLADHVLCVSKDTAESIIGHYGVDPAKVHVVENSIDVDRFRALGERPRDASHLLFIGRLEERKGVDILLQAFAELTPKYPELQLTLAGANLMGDRVHQFIAEHHLEGRVHLPGRISHEYMMNLLASKTILIVPSRLEGFGLIAAEGMAAGIPVLVSDALGLRSIVRDHETGRVCRSSDAEDMVRVLEEMRRDGSIHSIADRARKEALVRFDPARQACETMRLYAVAKKSGRAKWRKAQPDTIRQRV